VLESMFDSIAPENSGREARIFEVLDDLALELESLRPEVRAPLEHTLGKSYFALTLYDEARPHLEAALALFETQPELPATKGLAVRADLCALDIHLGHLERALAESVQLTADYEAVGVPMKDYATVIAGLSSTLIDLGRVDEAIALLEANLAKLHAAAPDESAPPSLELSLGRAYSYVGREDEAIVVLKSARELLLAKYGPNHPDPIAALILLAQVTKDSGDYATAGPLTESALASCLEYFGEDNLLTITVAHNLAGVRSKEGNYEEALRQESYAAELAEGALPELHPLKGYIYEVESTILAQLEHREEALDVQRQSLEVWSRVVYRDLRLMRRCS